MIRSNLKLDGDATQASNVINLSRYRLWKAEAQLREMARWAQSLEELHAIYAIRHRVVLALMGSSAVWRNDSIDEDDAPASGQRLPHHPIAALFPMMDKNSPEYKALVADIRKRKLLEPITMCDGMILDGRNRHDACLEAGVEPHFREFSDANEMSPVAFVLSQNLYRRHLTEGQRAMKADAMVTTAHGGNRKANTTDHSIKRPIGPLIDGPVTIANAARLWCISPRSVKRARFVRDQTDTVPTIVAEVEAGRMTLGRAALLAKETAEEQREAPDVKFAGIVRKPKPPKPPTAALAQALMRLNDDDLVEAFDELIAPRINRALKPKGLRVAIIDDLAKEDPDERKCDPTA